MRRRRPTPYELREAGQMSLGLMDETAHLPELMPLHMETRPVINHAALDGVGLTVSGADKDLTVKHPLITGMEYREYQVAIAASTVDRNVLAILPTGLGKTNIAVLAAARQLQDAPEKKVLILAPTKPLVEQHAETFREQFSGLKVGVLTGRGTPEKRKGIWAESNIVAATPQTIRNDVQSGRISLDDVSMMVVDEAHRATKGYPYVELAGEYGGRGRILGLTASPGSKAEKILGICSTIGVDSHGIEIRIREDADVAPYIQYTERNVVRVSRQDVGEIEGQFTEVYMEVLGELRRRKVIDRPVGEVKVRDLVEALKATRERVDSFGQQYCEEKGIGLEEISLLSQAMKLNHAVNRLSRHGVYSTLMYLNRIRHDHTHASERIFADERVRRAMERMGSMLSEEAGFPKMDKVVELAKKHEGRVIVFTEYRDNVGEIVAKLEGCGITARRFIGQAGKGGMSQTEQQETLRDFRDGRFKALVATSVGEEGLDIPEVEAAIMFEPVSDERRLVQREGRTGRHKPGHTYILIAEGSVDEPIYWKSYWQWHMMRDNIGLLKGRRTLD